MMSASKIQSNSCLRNLRFLFLLFFLLLSAFEEANAQNFWQQTNGPNGGVINSLVSNASGDIFVGTNGGGVFRSIDNGDSWTAINSGLTNTQVLVLAINVNGHIFAGTNGRGMFRSTNNGDSWTAINSGLPSTQVLALAINANGHIFVGTTDYGVFRSTNNGDFWMLINIGLTNTQVLDLAINANGDIFVGTNGGGVFRSTNNGGSWTAINNGLTNTQVLDLAINANGDIFVGTNGGGVFRSIDNGGSWMAINTGLMDNVVHALAINSFGIIFAGTNGGVVFRSVQSSLAPLVITDLATKITSSSTELNGAVNPNGLTTTIIFEYGTTTSYGNQVGGMPSPVIGTIVVSVSAALMGLSPNTLYHYRVVASNNGGTTFGADQTFTTETTDKKPPQITHTAIVTATSGQSQTISATLTDNVGVQSAKLFYRRGGASAYDSTAMTKTTGDTYQGVIPSGFITERGTEYYISTQDVAGNRATFPVTNPQAKPQVIQVINGNLTFANPTPVMAYRMISVPFDLNDKSPASTLEDDLGRYDDIQWRLLRYVTGVNVEFGSPGFANFAPGTGFWLITKEAKTIDAGAGKSVSTAQNYIINLPAGWSQIGNPFAFIVNWSDVIKDAKVESRLVGYQGTLNEATGYDFNRTQLLPFEGYFIHNLDSSSTTIEIPPKAATGGVAAKPAADGKSVLQGNEWALQITAACERYLDKDNYIGCLNEAADEWDANDFSEAPFFADHISLYFPHREWQKYPDLYTGDFREFKSEGDYWDFVVKSEVAKSEVERPEVVLRLAEVQNLPADWQIILLDKASRVAVNFGERKNYSFLPEAGKAAREFRIVVGQKDFVVSNDLRFSGVPQDFVLGQNYPNPFNPETRINYELPATSHVKIAIYNLSGQLIRTLFDNEQNVGRYTVAWDGTNTNGNRVASGVYLVRMEVGDPSTGSGQRFVAVRKMILAK